MGPILWSLKKLFITDVHTFDLLDEWYSREYHSFMNTMFHAGLKFHPGNVTKFTKADYLDTKSKIEGRVNWRRNIAKRLFGIRYAAASRFTQLNKYATEVLRSPLHADHYWLASNCRPTYGHWVMKNPNKNPNNPTGKPCEHRFCPWCYIRKYEYLCRLLGAEPTVMVKDYRGRTVYGTGPHLKVSIAIYDSLGDPFNAAFIDQLATLCFTQASVKSAAAHVKALLGRTGRIVSTINVPLYSEDPDDQVMIGQRVAIFHTGNIDKATVGHQGLTQSLENVELHAAVQYAMPYPVDFLRSDKHIEVKHKLSELFFGSRSFTHCRD